MIRNKEKIVNLLNVARQNLILASSYCDEKEITKKLVLCACDIGDIDDIIKEIERGAPCQ